MTYTSELQALRAEIAELKRRQDEIDSNTIGHLNRILENQKGQSAPTPNVPPDAPQPPVPPVDQPQPSTYPPEVETERAVMRNMDVVRAANRVTEAINVAQSAGYHNVNVRAFAFKTLFSEDQWVNNPAISQNTRSYIRNVTEADL